MPTPRKPPTPITDVIATMRLSTIGGTREALEFYQKMYPNIYKNLVTFFHKAKNLSR